MFQKRREKRGQDPPPPPPPYTVEWSETGEERPLKELPVEYVREKLQRDLAQKPIVSRTFIRELLGEPPDQALEVPADLDLETLYMTLIRMGRRLETVEKGQDLIIGSLPYCYSRISDEDVLVFRSIRQWLDKVDQTRVPVPVGRKKRINLPIKVIISAIITVGFAVTTLFWPELVGLFSIIGG